MDNLTNIESAQVLNAECISMFGISIYNDFLHFMPIASLLPTRKGCKTSLLCHPPNKNNAALCSKRKITDFNHKFTFQNVIKKQKVTNHSILYDIIHSNILRNIKQNFMEHIIINVTALNIHQLFVL